MGRSVLPRFAVHGLLIKAVEVSSYPISRQFRVWRGEETDRGTLLRRASTLEQRAIEEPAGFRHQRFQSLAERWAKAGGIGERVGFRPGGGAPRGGAAQAVPDVDVQGEPRGSRASRGQPALPAVEPGVEPATELSEVP